MSILTFKYRVKDSVSGKHLARHAVACNQVWNFCVATQREAERRRRSGMAVRWPTAFDLIKLCTGSSAELGLHSDTVQTICRQFAASRDLHPRCPRFRSSFGPKRALGWVPFIPRAVAIDGDAAVYLKRRFRFWKHRDIEGLFKAGSFVQDARGRWYVTFQCAVADELSARGGEIGIDLGLKSLATCSNGHEVPAMRHYRQYERALGKALNPCSDSFGRVSRLLGGKKGWNGNKIDASAAKAAGCTFNDIVWAASALAKSDPDIERRLRLWTADCAARVLHIYETHETSDAPRNAIIAARQFARGEIDDAAWDAAWDAARDAAWDAAWDAEEAWQFDRLIAWLSDDEPADWPLPERSQAILAKQKETA